jgi:dienelactone hydrolase
VTDLRAPSLLLLGALLGCGREEPSEPERSAATPPPIERINIQARDGLELVADLYPAREPAAPFLVLFHQARSSRGEYQPIAPRLVDLGYACLAIDLRIGTKCRGVLNRTAARFRGSPTTLDALPDIEDTLRHAREHLAQGPLVAWGSAFSAALVLQLAGTDPSLVDGVIAFGPAEYFTSLGKPATWIRDSAQGIRCPVFITSEHGAQADWQPIFDAISVEAKSSFLPAAGGAHGSFALWEESTASAEVWQAVEAFLARHFPSPRPEASQGG